MSVRAVLLAGGHGSRMGPVVGPSEPKALLPVGSRPAIFYSALSLLRAGVNDITVVCASPHAENVRQYLLEVLPSDPLCAAACSGRENIADLFNVVEREDRHETADSLRALALRGGEYHVIVLSADTVSSISLKSCIEDHLSSRSSCSVLYTKNTDPAPSMSKMKSPRPELYVVKDNDSDRLLGVVGENDLEKETRLRVRGPLFRRCKRIAIRSDLVDPHIYIFSPLVISHILPARPEISSIRFDLVPYLARRQFSLTKMLKSQVGDASSHRAFEDPLTVSCKIVEDGLFSYRINTSSRYLQVALAVTSGALEQYLTGSDLKKKSRSSKLEKSPFAVVGARVSVSADSAVGKSCSAGDASSVKRSYLADDVKIGSNVKVNGCVVLRGAHIGDGSNLAGCIVCTDAHIGESCKLRDCAIAAGVDIPKCTEANEKQFASAPSEIASGTLYDEIEFT